MAGSPPKPPPPAFAAGSLSPKPSPPTLAAGSSAPKPPPPAFYVDVHHPHEELVDSYLRRRVVSGTKVDFIHEADLYSANPDQLTQNYRAVTAINGEKAWYFFTRLCFRGSCMVRRNRRVNTGRKGSWVENGGGSAVKKGRQQIGLYRRFRFEDKADGKSVDTAWRMQEFLLDPKEGGQAEDSADLLVLCKVFRSPDAKADDESSTAGAKADGETSAASGVATPARKGAGEEIGAETAAGPGRKRKAGDKDSGAETVALSLGLQKKADGESAGAATTGEIFADSKDPLDAAEKAEQEEPRVRWGSRLYDLFLQKPKKR